jgi:hypothetical protein
MAEAAADDRCDEPVAPLATCDHPHRLLLSEEAVGGDEASGTDDDLRVWRRLDVAQPVGIGTKGAHYDRLGTFFSILHDFQNGVAAQASAAPDIDQQQEPVSEQPAALPAVQVHWGPKDATQRSIQSGRGHEPFDRSSTKPCRHEACFGCQKSSRLAFAFGSAPASVSTGSVRNKDRMSFAGMTYDLGVEMGQIMFVAVVLGIPYGFARLAFRLPRWTNAIPRDVIGTIAMVWFFARVGAMIQWC